MGDFIDKIANRAGGKTKGPDAVVVEVDKPPGYGDVEKAALDDLAKILRVPPEAREDFDGAMHDFVMACMKHEDKGDTAEPPADSEE